MPGVVDLAAESRRPSLPWLDALSRAIAFELVGSVIYYNADPERERLVKDQHIQNARLLEGYVRYRRN